MISHFAFLICHLPFCIFHLTIGQLMAHHGDTESTEEVNWETFKGPRAVFSSCPSRPPW